MSRHGTPPAGGSVGASRPRARDAGGDPAIGMQSARDPRVRVARSGEGAGPISEIRRCRSAEDGPSDHRMAGDDAEGGAGMDGARLNRTRVRGRGHQVEPTAAGSCTVNLVIRRAALSSTSTSLSSSASDQPGGARACVPAASKEGRDIGRGSFCHLGNRGRRRSARRRDSRAAVGTRWHTALGASADRSLRSPSFTTQPARSARSSPKTVVNIIWTFSLRDINRPPCHPLSSGGTPGWR